MNFMITVLALLMTGLLAVADESEAIPENAAADRRFTAAAKDLTDLYRVTSQPVRMDRDVALLCRIPTAKEKEDAPHAPHRDAYYHVYVSRAGQKAMESRIDKFPRGTMVVKQKFSDPEGKSPELFTLMQKREPGYDPEHGDWEYAIVNRTATQVLARGRLESCIDCHKAYARTDYVTRAYPIKAKPTAE